MTVKPAIGIAGMGIMGSAMAINAKRAGFPVRVYNRSEIGRKKAEAAGLEILDSPRKLAEQSDGVVVMVTDPPAVRDVLLGPQGVLAAAVQRKTLIQMSTIDEDSTLAFAEEAKSRGMVFLDCPVTGSKKQVEEAQLILLAGGEAPVIERWKDFLLSVGKTIVHAGDIGKGTALKLCMNLIVAQMTTALCESVALAKVQQLNPEKIFEVIEHSPALNCGYYQIKKKALLEENFSPAFSLGNMLKDVRFMVRAARKNRLSLPVSEAVQSVMEKALLQGLGSDDLTGIAKVLLPGNN